MGALLDGVVNQFRDRGMPGISVIELKADDKKHLYGPKRKAWYRLNEYVSPKTGKVWLSGVFGFKDEWWKVEHEGFEALSDEERQAAQAEWARKEAEYQAKQQQGYRNAASRARQQLQDAARAGGSAYLVRKQVKKPESVRFMQDDKLGWIIIPLLRYDRGEIVGVQKISPQKLSDGNDKLYSSGFEKVGAACRLGDEPIDGDLILIAEGYATAATGREATDYASPVFMALDSGNLPHVARILRAKYPNSPFLFLADDDYLPNKRGDENHTGEKKAFAASQEVGNAVYVLPIFSTERRIDPADELLPKLTDFNDLHIAEGVEVVAQQIQAAIALLLYPKVELSLGVSPLPAPAKVRVEAVWANDDWIAELVVNPKTELYKPVLYNVHMILLNDASWRGVIAYNQFTKRVEKLKPPPFFGGNTGVWSDVDTSKTLMWLQKRYGLDTKEPAVIDRAVLAVGQDCSFHPVREYLDSLAWDGTARLAHVFSDVFGATESYAGEAGQNFMVAAVARIFQPGCKVDEMIVLEGPQGVQKSTAIRTLFSPQFYLEQSEDPSGKDFYLCLHGKWGIEIGEMNSFRRAQDWTAVKLAISRRTDKFRAPYDRHAVEQDRECVFLGTTNEDEWLNDPTGGRRFIPIKAKCMGQIALVEVNRDQYWAEAVALYQAAHKWWVYSDEVVGELELERDARQLSDSWIEPIMRWLDGHGKTSDYEGMSGPIDHVTINQVLIGAIGFAQDKITAQHEQRVGKVMRRLKWIKKRASKRPGSTYRPWVFERPVAASV